MLNFSSDPFSIAVKLERFEGVLAVLRNENIGEFRWPSQNLPGNLNIGDTILLKVSTQKMEEEEKYEKMRKLLEELIN